MANLTADDITYFRTRGEVRIEEIDATGSTRYYLGDNLVYRATSGTVGLRGGDDASVFSLGVVCEPCDNSTGVAGAKKVKYVAFGSVARRNIGAITGSFGATVYQKDSQLVTLSGTATSNGVPLGKCEGNDLDNQNIVWVFVGGTANNAGKTL